MRPQVVRTRLRDLEIDKRADREGTRHEDQPIDLRSVPPRAADGDRLAVAGFVLGLADGLDKDLHRRTDQRLVLPQRDCLLRLHDRVATLRGDVCRHCGQIEGDRLCAWKTPTWSNSCSSTKSSRVRNCSSVSPG
jgi:hypothetical protein